MTKNKIDWKNEPGYKAVANLLLRDRTDKELMEIKKTIERCNRKETRFNLILVGVGGTIGVVISGIYCLVDWMINGTDYPEFIPGSVMLYCVPFLVVTLMSYKYSTLARRIDKMLESRILEEPLND